MMRMLRRVTVFRDRHPLVGPAFWLLSTQYYIAQFLVALAWPIPFSLRSNTISDLGNTVCGAYGERFVCSPLHSYMNTSFIALGLTMILGSILLPNGFRQSRAARFGFYGMTLAGVGTLLVGLFPENTISFMHILGAGLPFVLGNVALILFAASLQLPAVFKVCTYIAGIGSLVALGLFLNQAYFGLGIGGMERIVAYPQSLWLIAFGWYVSRDHFMGRRARQPRNVQV